MTSHPHLRPSLILLVAAGGGTGVAARNALVGALGTVQGWPVATFTANLLGAFLLGGLLELLLRQGPENPRRRGVRLGLGTGLLGGFTTFSTLAVEVERLAATGHPGMAVAYGVASVVLGVAAALAGVVLAARKPWPRSSRRRPRAAVARVARQRARGS